MAERAEENPYVGPRPFELGETGLFFGREREQRELLSLVVAHRVVLLYAASGAGKTSLLNAGLVPALEAEGFDVLPPARVRSLSADEEVPTESNVYVFGLLTHISEAEGEDVGDATIAAFLARREHAVGPDGYPAPRALIVDQLEELLTLHQGRWPERDGFFRQLAEAVQADPLLRIVLAIREDYLAQLDPYARLLPDRLRARIRLERLGAEAALKAATAPARHAGRSFAPGVAENLVSDLLQARVASARGETLGVEGEYVEPVHLQVTCHSLWSGLPPDATEISEEHRLVFGDVDQVLSQFYEETIAAAASRAGMDADRLRERFEEAFITPLDTRGTVYWTPSATAGMPAAAVDEMDGRHLIRAELRAGARWYELTHDRLIGPVRASNRKRRAERAARRRRRQAQFGLATLAVGLVALAGAAIIVLAGGSEEAVVQEGDPARTEELEDLIEEQARAIASLALILRTQGGRILQTSFSADGERVLTLGRDRRVQIWNTFTGQTSASFRPFTAGTVFAEFAPPPEPGRSARRVLVARLGGPARVVSTAGKTLATLPARAGQTLAARFTKRGPVVVALDADGQATVWQRGRLRPLLGSAGVLAADVSADGRFVATDSGFRLAVWQTATGGRVATFRLPPHAPSPLLSPGGSWLVTPGAAGKLLVWNSSRRSLVHELLTTEKPGGALAFSPDGSRLAAAGDRFVVRVLALASGKVLVLRGHEGKINDVDLSPDGRLAVTASDDGTARLWSLATGKVAAVLDGAGGPVVTARFSPDTLLTLTGGADGAARVWGSGPDLTLAGIRFDRSIPGAQRIRGRVENIGNTASQPTVVVARAGGASERQDIPALQPGQTSAISLALPEAGPGEGSVLDVVVDPDRLIRELLDTNNLARLSTAVNVVRPPPPDVAAQRKAIVAGALTAVRKAKLIHYTAGPQRMDGVRRKVRLPQVPRFEDTSSFVTWCYFQADLPDPSRLGYNGLGYSGSLIDHGRPVSQPKLGDIVFYGSPGAIRYVGIFVGDGKIVAHRLEAGPAIQPLKAGGAPKFAIRSYLP